MIQVSKLTLTQAARFMTEAGYRPLREGSVRAFLMTSVGDDLVLLEEDGTQLLFVLRHKPKDRTTFLRAAVKKGAGDAMDLAFRAAAQGALVTQPQVVTDVPVDKLRDKLLVFTNGTPRADGATVLWNTDLTHPTESTDV